MSPETHSTFGKRNLRLVSGIFHEKSSHQRPSCCESRLLFSRFWQPSHSFDLASLWVVVKTFPRSNEAAMCAATAGMNMAAKQIPTSLPMLACAQQSSIPFQRLWMSRPNITESHPCPAPGKCRFRTLGLDEHESPQHPNLRTPGRPPRSPRHRRASACRPAWLGEAWRLGGFPQVPKQMVQWLFKNSTKWY